MRECLNCSYKRYPAIPPPKPFKADLMIISEAPSVHELGAKTQLAGPGRELVEKTMDAVGLPHLSEVFVTNGLFCRPPGRKTIGKEAINTCRAHLLREVEEVQPKVIIVMGNVATQGLFGNTSLKITQIQGQVHRHDAFGKDVMIVPCFHPAAILRDGSKYKQFYSAFKLARRCLGTPEEQPIGPPDPVFTIVNSTDVFERAMRGLMKCKRLSADIETGRPEGSGKKILVLGICWTPGKVVLFPDDWYKKMDPLFRNEEVIWSWYNGKYDAGNLARLGHPVRVDEDPMLLHYALNENPGTHDLEQVGIEYLHIDRYWKQIQPYIKDQEKIGYEAVPRDLLYPYNAKDCDVTERLFDPLWAKVSADPRLVHLYKDTLLPGANLLQSMENRGMPLGAETVLAERERLQEEIAAMSEEIGSAVAPLWDPEIYKKQTAAKTAPAIFNPGSPKQVAWLVYDKMKLRVPGVKGRSTAEEVLEKIKKRSPVLMKITELRSLKNSLSKYVDGPDKKKDPEGRVHATFNIHSTVTGRLSCTKPNLQNVPKDRRIIYQTEPGRTFLEADYKAAELRVLAYISNDRFLKEVFIGNRDLHNEMSIALFGPNFTDSDRMKAKTVNFGIPYGRSPESIAEQFGIPLWEAQKMVRDWLARAPEAAAYLRSCDEAAAKGEVLDTPFGRLRRFGLVSEYNLDELQNEARNFRIQSISSDLMLHSAIRVNNEIKKDDCHVVNLVHDSMLIDLPDNDEIVEQVARRVIYHTGQVPKDLLGTDVPFLVDLKRGPVWSDMIKYKIAS